MAKNDVVKETEYNTKIKNIEDKIPDIPSTTNLATTAALTAVENKIPNFSNLVKKKKMTVTQKLMKFKRKLLIMIIVISILLHKNLIS